MNKKILFSASERVAVATMALIYGLRMLGLFLIMPVIAIDLNSSYEDISAIYIGLVIGIYGLTQAIFQIPFGIASDRFGRKPIIIFGLLIFSFASFWAANAGNVEELVFARALQGVGAVSAAANAFLADLTRQRVRAKAMGIIGISVGFSFLLSLILSPILYGLIELSGIFYLIGLLGLFATFLVIKIPLNKDNSHKANHLFGLSLKPLVLNIQILRLNLGIFFLMFTQASIFLLIPNLMLGFGVEVGDHWKMYLPVLLFAFLVMFLVIVKSEQQNQQKKYFLISISLVLFSIIVFWMSKDFFLFWLIGLCIYFVGFNLLEAFLPAWVSKLASPSSRGLALGMYNTWQSLGIFAGGFVGGQLLAFFDQRGVFLFCIFLMMIWFWVSLGLEENNKIPKNLELVK